MERTGKLAEVTTDDWAVETLPAWRHSVWVGVWDPWPVVKRPYLWWKVIRDAWCLEVMHRAFTNGLMECKRRFAAPRSLRLSVHTHTLTSPDANFAASGC